MERFCITLVFSVTLCAPITFLAKVKAQETEAKQTEAKQSEAKQSEAKQQAEQARRVEQLRGESLARAKEIRVTLPDGGSAVALNQTPLLRFGEPTRGNEDGSLWTWGSGGRPLVIAEIYHNAGDTVQWFHAISLVSTQWVTAETGAGRWAPRKVQLDLKTIPNTPPPSDRALVRLRQMKALARRFEAHEFWEPNNTRYELRLLASPVYRYQATQDGLLDGGLFIFAHGTNPEIVMLVEAHKSAEKAETWNVGFVPLGSAELHVTLADREFWKLPRAAGVTGRPEDPYWLFVVTAAGQPAAEDPSEKP